MTLDEAIKHCEEKAKENKERAEQIKHFTNTADEIAYCLECAKEHEQLAVWLKDYKRLLKESPQGDCENCDFRKFSEKFIDGVVDVMNKNGITSVEELQERLKGGAE